MSIWDDAFAPFGGTSVTDPVRLDPGATQAWRDGVDTTSSPLTPTSATSSILGGSPSNNSSGISSGQSKFNGWANYLTGSLFGTPSGNATNADGTNPGAFTGGAGTGATGVNAATGAGIDWNSWFARGGLVVLGLVFVGVGLSMFGEGKVLQVVKGKV